MVAVAGYRKPRTAPNHDGIRAVLAAESDTVSSLWVGYWLPSDVAKKVAIKNGEVPDDLHMTLSWLGNAAALPDDALERLRAAVQMFSLSQAAVSFKLSGAARFSAADSGRDKDVIYATVAGDAVYDFQWRLAYALESVGLSSASAYGFTPHITLAYVDPGADVSLKLPNAELSLSALTISKGKDTTAEDRETFELRPPAYRTMYAMEISGSLKAMEPPKAINVLPIPGLYYHPLYGNIDLSEARLQNFVTNFENHVYQDRVPIDLEHETKLGGAAGWIVGLTQNTDGSVDAAVEWTDRGIEAIKADRFGFISPEWYDYWTDPISGIDYSDVLIGAALCTRPFFKAPALRPLGMSEPKEQQHQEVTTVPEENKNEGTTQTQPAASPGTAIAASPVAAPVGMSEEMARAFADLKADNERLARENAAHKTTNETLSAQMGELSGTVKTMAEERRRERYTGLVTGRAGGSDGVRWFGEPAVHVKTLEHIANTAGEDSELFRDYVKQQTAMAEQMRDSSRVASLTYEVGSSGEMKPDTGVAGRVADAAQKYMSEHPGTSEAAAVSHVVMTDVALALEYRAYLREKGRQTGGRR